MTLFNVWMHFSVAQDSTVTQREIWEFLRVLPDLLKHVCKRDITFDVIRTYLSGPTSMTVVATLNVIPPPSDYISDNDTQRFGIKDPEATRATTALMLWLNSLRRLGDSPLYAAWVAYCKQKDWIYEDSATPIILMSHGFKVVTPPPSPPLPPDALVAAEAPPKVDPVAIMQAALYDGSTQTTT
jgi:hypothetical protein